jgi:ferritin-like metal-binding protein YciE
MATATHARTHSKAKTNSHLAAAKQQAVKTQKGLSDLLLHGLKDIYYAEKKLTVALPKMIKAAQSPDLSDALSAHLDETHDHVKKVEEVFDLLNQQPKAVKCEAIDGIVAEAESILREFSNTAAGDAAIIFSGQAAEHYEITRYGSMLEYAKILRYDEARDILKGILDQEKAADQKLTELAVDRIDYAAADSNDGGSMDDAIRMGEVSRAGKEASHSGKKSGWRFWQ